MLLVPPVLFFCNVTLDFLQWKRPTTKPLHPILRDGAFEKYTINLGNTFLLLNFKYVLLHLKSINYSSSIGPSPLIPLPFHRSPIAAFIIIIIISSGPKASSSVTVLQLSLVFPQKKPQSENVVARQDCAAKLLFIVNIGSLMNTGGITHEM